MSGFRSSINPYDYTPSTDHLRTSRFLEADKTHPSHLTTASQSLQTSPGFIYQSPSSIRDSVKALTNYDNARALKQDQKDLDRQISSPDFQAWKKSFVTQHRVVTPANTTTTTLISYPEVKVSSAGSYAQPLTTSVRADIISDRVSRVISSIKEDYRYPRSSYKLSGSGLTGERTSSTSPHRDYLRSEHTRFLSPQPAMSLRSSTVLADKYGFKTVDSLNKSAYTTGKKITPRESVVLGSKSANLARLDHLVADIQNRNNRIDYTHVGPLRPSPISSERTSIVRDRSGERERGNAEFVFKKSPRKDSFDSRLPSTFKPDLLAGFQDAGNQEDKDAIEKILSRYKRDDSEDIVHTTPGVVQRKLYTIPTPEKIVKSQPPYSQKVGSPSQSKISKEMSLKIAIGAIVMIILLVLGYCYFFDQRGNKNSEKLIFIDK